MEKPKSSADIISLGEKRMKMQNKNLRTEVQFSPEGNALYPERPVEITMEEAASLADEVLLRFSDPESVIQDFIKREKQKIIKDPFDPKIYNEDIEKSLRNKFLSEEKVSINGVGVEYLLTQFENYKKNPDFYYAYIILAAAKELKRILSNNK